LAVQYLRDRGAEGMKHGKSTGKPTKAEQARLDAIKRMAVRLLFELFSAFPNGGASFSGQGISKALWRALRNHSTLHLAPLWHIARRVLAEGNGILLRPIARKIEKAIYRSLWNRARSA
jgi:hypothetical protein